MFSYIGIFLMATAFNWGIMVIIANTKKKEISKAMYIICGVIIYIIEIIIGVITRVFIFNVDNYSFNNLIIAPISSGLVVGLLTGIIFGWKTLKQRALLCDNKAYKDLSNRKNDIKSKILQAENIKEKQILKICEASMNENYSYWTINNWWKNLEKELLNIELFDKTNGLDAMLCIVSSKKYFKNAKVLVSQYDRCANNFILDNRNDFIEELNKTWKHFPNKEWINEPHWEYDSKNPVINNSQPIPWSETSNKTNIKYIFCRKCGAKMPADSTFCAACGEKFIFISDKCPYCGKQLLEGARFCNKCGKAV